MEGSDPNNALPKRDVWEKMGIIGTFVSTVFIGIFTAVVTYQTDMIRTKVENFKAVQEEGTAVSNLIKELSKDENSTLKFDYAFLALERYLRNTNEDGELKPQDKAMLIGFAQSLIFDRVKASDSSKIDRNKILIPQQFLEKNDTIALGKVLSALGDLNKVSNVPAEIDGNLKAIGPVSEIVDAQQSKSISLLVKKIVYIQYADSSRSHQAIEIQKMLRDKGWVAPGIERVKGKYYNCIKYFHSEDRILADEVNGLFGSQFKVVSNQGFEKSVPKARSRCGL